MAVKQTVLMQLPTPSKEWWSVGQGNAGAKSHFGLDNFAFDFNRALPGSTSKGAPIFAPCRGKIVDIKEDTGEGLGIGPGLGNLLKIEVAPGQRVVPIHIAQNSVSKLGLKKFDNVEMGQQVASVGDTGTEPGNFHLHIALSNEPIATEATYTTIASEFMNYEVSTDQGKTAKFMRFGTPKQGEWIRRLVGWSPWTSLGGKITLAPAVASTSGVAVDMYARADNYRLWQKFWDGSTWSHWFPVETNDFIMSSSPALFALGPDHRDVYALGKNGILNRNWWDGKTRKWSGWQSVGSDKIQGAVSVVYPAPNVIDIYARGTDSKIRQQFWNGSSWSGWIKPNMPDLMIESAPSVFCAHVNHRDLYVRGADGALYRNWWDGNAGQWHAWENLGGEILGAPAAISRKPGQIDVFAVATDNRLWQKSWNGGPDWGPWFSHDDGFPLLSSVAVTSRAPEHLEVYAQGEDHAVWQKWWVGES